MASASLAPPASNGQSTSAPAIKVVNLHPAYRGALPLAHHGRIMGKLQPRGKHVSTKAPHGPTTCAEPNCNLAYGGGSIQHHPHVYLLLWGPSWNSASPDAKYLAHFYQGLGVGSQDNWSSITSQYTDGSGHPVFGGSVLQGVYQDTTAPPANVSQTDLTAEADAFVTNQGVTDLADAQIIIASQSGTCFSDGFAGNSSGCAAAAGGYCAWHTNSSQGETLTNLPYLLDAGTGCGQNFSNSGSAGIYDGFSIVGGHEYAETITDPAPVGGWYDTADSVSGGEIGDKCAWAGQLWSGSDPAGDVTLSTGTFAMQSLWSNSAGSCVMAAAAVSSPPVVTGVSPSHGPTAGGTPVTVTGTHLSGGTVTFGSHAATGVTCGATSCTATPPAGTGTVDVRVTTTVATSATSSADHFTYTVPPPPSGAVTGYRGKCVADVGILAHTGNPVDLWTCNGSSGQVWTVQLDSTLRVGGKCMTVLGTANRSKVDVVPCNGTWNQVWVHHTNGELTDPHTGKCLTDPAYRTTNGTQLVLMPCGNTANQHWHIP